MFGGSAGGFGFGSTQNQQQLQQPTLFGSNASFGTFGSQATTSSTGFGAFGAGGSLQPTTSSAPAFGFGGGGSNLFGGSTGFGGLSSSTGTTVIPANGTANPHYSATIEKDQPAGSVTHFHSISAMPAYKNFSFEELRLKDYEIGRKPSATLTPSFGGATSSTPAFGAASSGFGAASPGFGPANNSGFGAGGPFGAQSSTLSFGSKTTSSPSFGFGVGAATPNTGFGATNTLFGANPKPVGAFGGSAFGGGLGSGLGSSNLGGGGGAAGAAGGGSIFGAAASSAPSIFSNKTAATTPFGVNQANAFGNPSNTFGFSANKTTASVFQTNVPSIAQPSTPFGMATQPSTGFGFNNAAKPAFSLPSPGVQSPFLPAAASTSTSFFSTLGNPASTSASSTFSGFSFPKSTSSNSGFTLSAPTSGFGGGSSMFPSSLLGSNQPGTFQAGQLPQTSVEQSPYGMIQALNPTTLATTSATSTTVATPSLTGVNKKKPILPQYKLTPKSTSKLKMRVYSPAAQKTVSTPEIKPWHIFDGTNKAEMLSPEAFRQPKKLIIEHPVTVSEVLTPDKPIPSTPVRTPTPKAPTFKLAETPEASSSSTPSKTPTLQYSIPIKTPTPKAPFKLVETPEISSPLSTPSKTPTSQYNGTPETSDKPSSLESKRGAYWVCPDLLTLKRMDKEELKKVRDFQVGRYGYGQISFEVADLSGIPDLSVIPGGIIQFEKRSCQVYPDENSPVPKPSIGEGLNRPAKITLEECWPLDKGTRKPITDVNDQRYRQRIERLRETSGTRFIDFYAERGAWVFSVDHFSKYGLDLETEDDEYEERPLKKNVPQDEEPESSKSSHETTISKDAEGSRKPDQVKSPKEFAESLQLDPTSIHQMTNAIFPIIDEANSSNVQNSGKRSLPEPIVGVETSETEGHQVPDIVVEVEARSSFTTILAPISTPQFIRRRPNKYRRINYSESIPYKKEGYLQDAGLAMSRSFRVGWGPNGTLVHCGKICGISDIWGDTKVTSEENTNDLPTTVYLERLRIFADRDKEKEKKRHFQMLNELMRHTSISLDSNGVPFAETAPEITFSAFKDVTKSNIYISNEKSIWELAEALWDDFNLPGIEELTEEERTEVEKENRKRFVSKWFQANVKPQTKKHLDRCKSKKDNHGTILAHLGGYEIGKATLSAIENRDFRLSTLIPQLAGCDQKFRDFIQSQIQHWEEHDVDKSIPKDIWKIYQVLAGDVSSVYIDERFDWKRSLAMHIWYEYPLGAPLIDAFKRYEETLKKESDGPFPIAWYEDSPNENGLYMWTDPTSNRPIYDVTYHLLKLWLYPEHQEHNLKDLLNPRSVTPSPLDFRVTWFLYLILTRKTTTQYSADFFDDVTLSFLLQLEALGLWHWAIFVGLHINNSNAREGIIKTLINRYLPLTPKDTKDNLDSVYIIESFLFGELRVEQPDIEMAKAIGAKYQEDSYTEAACYLKAGRHTTGHDLIVKELAPEAILLETYENLEKILRKVEHAYVPNWHNGGELYLNIIDLLTETSRFQDPAQRESGSHQELQDIVRICHEILDAIQRTRPENRLQARCFAFADARARDVLLKVEDQSFDSLKFFPEE